jgi:hypothetical protein
MVRLYVAVSNRLAELFQGDRADAGMEELGYVVLLAVIGSGVLVGATVLRGAVISAFDRLVTLVNGIG